VRTANLGTTGLTVSTVIYGAGSIGGVGSNPLFRHRGISFYDGLERLDEAWRLGIRVVDTADAYAGGESERAVGQWVRLRAADGALIATKVGAIVSSGQTGPDLSPEHIARQLARSIERLGRVDLYLAHAADPVTPIEASMAAFARAQTAGTIRAYGVCNVDVPLLETWLAAADKAGLPRPGWVQNRFNLLDRTDEGALIPLVTAEGLGYTPFSPLGGGVLSDRYLDGHPIPADSRIGVAGDRLYAGMHTPGNLGRVAALRDIARRDGRSVAALALAWLLAHPAVTAPIVSPSTSAQWAAVEEAIALDLSKDQVREISDLFR
jgi:1-deoxyxylulose-5-phosphate synthase